MNRFRIEIMQNGRAVTVHWPYQLTEKDIYEIRIPYITQGELSFRLCVPSTGVHYRWTPKIHLIKGLNLNWFNSLYLSNRFTGAPVECLVGENDENRAVFGLSETLYDVRLKAVPIEETAEYGFEVTLFRAGNLTIRLDLRQMAYYEALAGMAAWWERQEGMAPAPVPGDARHAMYSTWYSYHQDLREESLLEQCRIAAGMGLRTLLLDDGWQTGDNNRGYAWCGDWAPSPSKISDMKEFVRRVHELGMKVMVWYSVPFIGEKSANFSQFEDMLIDGKSGREWHVLDPRYGEVREFIIGLYDRALREWDLDGFKLDFVDEFVVTPFDGRETDARRDYQSFAEAADRLMRDCIRRLKDRKPEIMLEFRQTYNGPGMRIYGNIFRAVDCPFDALENKIRVTDIRLLAGGSSVHSDMLMWDVNDSPQSAALQIIRVLFSVPQISMRLDCLPREHEKMLRFYLGLWQKYRDAFLSGSFEPHHPAQGYSVITGTCGCVQALVFHACVPARVDESCGKLVMVNGSGTEWLLLYCQEGGREYRLSVFDCQGNLFLGRVCI